MWKKKKKSGIPPIGNFRVSFFYFLCFITGLYIYKNVVYHHSLIIELTVCSFKNDSFKTYTIYFFSWPLNYKRLNFLKNAFPFHGKYTLYILKACIYLFNIFITNKMHIMHIYAHNAHLCIHYTYVYISQWKSQYAFESKTWEWKKILLTPFIYYLIHYLIYYHYS